MGHRQTHEGRVVCDGGRHRAASSGDASGAGGQVPRAGRLTARQRPLESTRHRTVLRHAGCDDVLHQPPAMERLPALRLERSGRVGQRSWRYSMLVRDRKIEKIFYEPQEPGDPFKVSDADTMLAYINPNAKKPDQVAVASRPGRTRVAPPGRKPIHQPISGSSNHAHHRSGRCSIGGRRLHRLTSTPCRPRRSAVLPVLPVSSCRVACAMPRLDKLVRAQACHAR